MNRQQEEILKIFEEFKRICDKYGFNYYAIGGTCIGAIRHKGFIPWDDDLDVGMPYSDYVRFLEVARFELRNPFELYDFHENEHAMFKFLKIHNANTTFIEKAVEQFPDRYTGIFIDVMPISGISSNKIKQRKFLLKCKILNRLDFIKRFKRIDLPEMKSIQNKMATFLLFPLIAGGKFNKFTYLLDKMWEKYDISQENDVFFTWRLKLRGSYKNIFPYEIFERNIELPFENTFIKVPIGYDEYLSMDFGDYMSLPPLEKQVPIHDYIVLDFDRSYKLYVKKYEKGTKL